MARANAGPGHSANILCALACVVALANTQKIPAERTCGPHSNACKKRAKSSGHAMIQMLLADARAALPGSRVVVFDVGANNGLWAAKEWPQVAAELREAGTRFDLFIIEPQPQFAKQLQAFADHYNFTFVRAAAWKQETTLDFDTMPSAGTGSMSATISRGTSLKGFVRTAVPAIDLAALLRVQLPEDGRTLSYLKLDVEGAEFELLPWLLLQGALCRVGYLLVEWHLNRVGPDKRLAALSLRHSLFTLLEHGCRTPPRAVLMDSFAANNYALPVPGLLELAQSHSICDRSQTSSWTNGLIRTDQQNFARWKAEASLVGQRNNDSRPRCFGRCEEVALGYDREMVQRSWERASKGNDTMRCQQYFDEWMGHELF